MIHMNTLHMLLVYLSGNIQGKLIVILQNLSRCGCGYLVRNCIAVVRVGDGVICCSLGMSIAGSAWLSIDLRI